MSIKIKSVLVEIISGVEGDCLAIDEMRVAGPKPWGGGRIISTFKVDRYQILTALGIEELPS